MRAPRLTSPTRRRRTPQDAAPPCSRARISDPEAHSQWRRFNRRILAAFTWRVRAARTRLRRAWYKDRPWIGRFVALAGNRVVLDDCRFTLAHPLVTDAMRARIVRGRYERSERELLDKWLDPDAPVIECGGGLGIVAVLVNRRLIRPRQHLVVEANPCLIQLLERQKALNGAAFTVLHGAIDYSGSIVASFNVNDDFISGRLDSQSSCSVAVPALTLRALIEQQPYQGATLICDIEGTETELIEHDCDVLAQRFEMLYIETHPEFRPVNQINTMFARLEQFGFARLGSVRKVHAFRNRHCVDARPLSPVHRIVGVQRACV